MATTPSTPEEALGTALQRALEALTQNEPIGRLAEYYRAESNYAGALYLRISPNESTEITAADLLAVSSLSIRIPPRAARRMLLEGEERAVISEKLEALPKKPLAKATDDDFAVMEKFYRSIRRALRRADSGSSAAWVTASKIAARKRPDLFPVRDTVVTTFLGTREDKSYFVDWAVFRYLMQQGEVTAALNEITNSLEKREDRSELIVETEPLRVLDVALWTHVKWPGGPHGMR